MGRINNLLALRSTDDGCALQNPFAAACAIGVTLKSVQMGKVQLPEDYRKGMESLMAEELASEKMRFTLELAGKQSLQKGIENEAEKQRREKLAQAAAQEQVIAAKGQEEAMKHVIPFKERLIAQREEEMRRDYLQACEPADSIGGKLEKLAAVRDAEGYMARVEQQGDQWLLIEDHCPICAAAQSCQGFCRSELQLFQDVLGKDASITRQEHALADGRRCVYRIGKAS